MRPLEPAALRKHRRIAGASLLVGMFSCAYVAAWTIGWSGAELPGHILALDAVFFVVMAICIGRLRARSAIGMLGAVLSHWAVQTRIVTAPVSSLDWGLWSVALGFLLLIASIGASLVVSERPIRGLDDEVLAPPALLPTSDSRARVDRVLDARPS